MPLYLAFIIAMCLCVADSVNASVKLPQLFSDHMVLQRDIPVPVRGWADPGEQVTVTIGGQSKAATADAGGKWTVKRDPLHVGAPLTLTVKGTNTLTLSAILVGEVWLCSGQSNMDIIWNPWAKPQWERRKSREPIRAGKTVGMEAARGRETGVRGASIAGFGKPFGVANGE